MVCCLRRLRRSRGGEQLSAGRGWPFPAAEGSPGRQERGDPGKPWGARGRGRHEASSLLPQSFFPSPCCYPRAPSWLKQSSKAGSCLPGQRGRLSINPFYFCSVLPNHFKFSLCKMWDIRVRIGTQCGFLSLKALPLGRFPSQLCPVQGLATTSPSPSVIQFTRPQNHLGYPTTLKSTILCVSFASSPENTLYRCLSNGLLDKT